MEVNESVALKKEIMLPKEKVKANRKNPKRLIIYSPPKVGKTTELSKLENNLILDLENGADFVDALKITINSLTELYDIGEQIKKEGRPYKFISVDTATKLEEWCEAYAKILYSRTPMGANFRGKSVLELPNGAGYLYLRQAFKYWLDYLESLSENLIIICHLQDKLIMNKRGEEVSAKDLALTGKLKSITAADADAIGYMYRGDNNELRINFASSDQIACGSRCDHLRGQDFEFDWSKIYID